VKLGTRDQTIGGENQTYMNSFISGGEGTIPYSFIEISLFTGLSPGIYRIRDEGKSEPE
jgi:hypothetical protein